MRLSHATFALAILAVAAGCDDPTGVGVELIDNQSGAPEIVELTPGLTTGQRVFDVTGGARRAIMGAVVDPLLGGTRAAAAIDFALASTVGPSAAFQAGPVTSVEMRLVPNYLFGDTTATIDFAISEITETWVATASTSSTPLTSGPTVSTASLNAADTLLTIGMPDSWIQANDADLRSQEFVSLFDGLLVEPLTDGVIFGIDVSLSSVRVVSGDDTLSFVLSRNLSLISRTSEGSLPPGLTVLQDGPGTGVGITFDFESAGVLDVSLSKAVVRVQYDSLAYSEQLPPNFVRPALDRVDLVGITADSIAVPLASTQVRDGELIFDDPVLASTLQSVLIDQSVFDRFALMGTLDLSPVENTVSGLLLKNGTTGTDGPQMALTVIRPSTL